MDRSKNELTFDERLHRQLAERDADYPNAPAIDEESVRMATEFLDHNPNLVSPMISSGSFGRLALEWHLAGNGVEKGVVVMMFTPPDAVDYAAISGPYKPDPNQPGNSDSRMRYHGTASPADVLDAIGEFKEKITQ